MIFRCLQSKTQLRLLVVVGASLLGSCNSSTRTDPFASPPIGQKFFIPANPDSHGPSLQITDVTIPRAVIIKLTNSSDISNSRSPVFALGGAATKPKSVTFYAREGANVSFSSERIEKANDTDSCKAILFDIQDLLTAYPGMTLVCGDEFSNAFSGVGSVVVTTNDDVDHQFTSWGTHWVDVGSYRLLIYSL